MEQVEQTTKRSDIIQWVQEDFGVAITDEQAGDILEANNHAQLTWTETQVRSVGHLNFKLTKEGWHDGKAAIAGP